MGLVRSLPHPGRPTYGLSDPAHHHTLCERCGTITDLRGCPRLADREPVGGPSAHTPRFGCSSARDSGGGSAEGSAEGKDPMPYSSATEAAITSDA